MTSSEALAVGVTGTDTVNDSDVVIVGHSDEAADEHVFTHDYNKQPVTVADHETNAQFDPDDTVVFVVYADSLSRNIPDWEQLSAERLLARIEETGVTQYPTPQSRIDPDEN